jgi:hypothetical protein
VVCFIDLIKGIWKGDAEARTAEVTARKRAIKSRIAPDLPSSAVSAAGATAPACASETGMNWDDGPADKEIMASPAAVANIHGTNGLSQNIIQLPK